MKTKSFIALILIVCLPLALLGWLGLRSVSHEQKLLQRQALDLIHSRLKSVDDSVQGYFASLERDLMAVSENLSHAAEDVRSFIRKGGRVGHVFIFNALNERQYPPANETIADKEEKFMERSRWIWSNMGAPRTKKTAQKSEDLQPGASPEVDGHFARGDKGWYVWFSGGEMSHIFWRRKDDGTLLGFELDPVRLKADLIGYLPDTGAVEGQQENSRIRLVDSQGRMVYQWGGHEPVENSMALAMIPMSHPLGSWKLEYFGKGLQVGAATGWLNVVAILLVVGAALLGLAFYLYREHTREMVLAQQRVNFVNQVSHELRSPLTNIRLYAELLDERIAESDEDSRENSKSRKYIRVIASESQRLSRLISNVLSFARGAKKRLILRPEAGRVDEIIRANMEVFRPLLENKGVKITLDLNADGTVRVDPDVLEQILANVFSNVEKYGAAGKRMEIESRWKDGQATIKVRDHGPGIPRRDQEKIFQPFYRVSSKLTDGVAGAGIGLSLARDLARLHGGDLTLVDAATGACFKIILTAPRVESAS